MHSETKPFKNTNFNKCYCGKCSNYDVNDTNLHEREENSNSYSSLKKKNELDWYRHLDRLERLSKPAGSICSLCPPKCEKRNHLTKTDSRIKALAQPKNPCKERMYMKDPQEIQSPKSVQNWPGHNKWLDKNSQPKICYHPECNEVDKYRRFSYDRITLALNFIL